jgi:hypothetical protein
MFAADFLGVALCQDFPRQAAAADVIVRYLMMHARLAGPEGFQAIGALQTNQKLRDRLFDPLVLIIGEFIQR